ncbi:MAG: leucyl aminopeptidase [Thermodesulfovibrionales bacterium]|nr:leucyl aminopeptidase [Thermodesulfovibrionales bacterium]
MKVKIEVQNKKEDEIKADVLVIPLFENSFPKPYEKLNSQTEGLLYRIIKSGEFNAKLGSNTLIHLHNSEIDRILLTGLGKKSEITTEKIRQSGGKALTYLKSLGFERVVISTKELDTITSEINCKESLPTYFLEGALLNLYSFDKYKKSEEVREIKNIVLLYEEKKIPLKWVQTNVEAVNFARDIINTPANDMTPTKLAEIANSLASKKINVKILERQEAQREGMNAFLSVAKGSNEPPKFIILSYSGSKGSPLVLIGKSITFDSGGISLKPAEGMEKMKYDMAGGAVVLAIIKGASQLDLPLNLIGILPATENLPGGNATKPGDVVSAITGKTIEIVNTDAEGRLAIADAIGYAIKYFKPKAIIDIATLTGACKITFGNEAAAMMGNNSELMDKIKEASLETYERVWEMPLYEEYKDYLKSDIAHLKNSAGKDAALLTGGYFLKEFVNDVPWIHLDIASVAWNDKDKPYLSKGATGFGVRLMLRFLKELS